MAASDRNTLKGFFLPRQIPRASHFARFIDSALNKAEDGIRKDMGGALEVQAAPLADGKREAIRFYKFFEKPVFLQQVFLAQLATSAADTFLRITYTGQGSPVVNVLDDGSGTIAFSPDNEDEITLNFPGASNLIAPENFQPAIEAFSSTNFSVELISTPGGSGAAVTATTTNQTLTPGAVVSTRLDADTPPDFLEVTYTGTAEEPGIIVKQDDSLENDVAFREDDHLLAIKIKAPSIDFDTIINNLPILTNFSIRRIGTSAEARFTVSAPTPQDSGWKLVLIDPDAVHAPGGGLSVGENTNDHFFIQAATGRVGIGTNKPAAALEVNGAIRAGSFETGGTLKAASIEVGNILNLAGKIGELAASAEGLEDKIGEMEASAAALGDERKTALRVQAAPLASGRKEAIRLFSFFEPVRLLGRLFVALVEADDDPNACLRVEYNGPAASPSVTVAQGDSLGIPEPTPSGQLIITLPVGDTPISDIISEWESKEMADRKGFSLIPLGPSANISMGADEKRASNLRQALAARVATGLDTPGNYLMVRYAGPDNPQVIITATDGATLDIPASSGDQLNIAIPTAATSISSIVAKLGELPIADRGGFSLVEVGSPAGLSLAGGATLTAAPTDFAPVFATQIPDDNPTDFLRVEYAGQATEPGVLVKPGAAEGFQAANGLITITTLNNPTTADAAFVTEGNEKASQEGFFLERNGNPPIAPFEAALPEWTLSLLRDNTPAPAGLSIGDTTNRLFLQADTGNVGIGTTSPTATLDINGSLQLSGALHFLLENTPIQLQSIIAELKGQVQKLENRALIDSINALSPGDPIPGRGFLVEKDAGRLHWLIAAAEGLSEDALAPDAVSVQLDAFNEASTEKDWRLPTAAELRAMYKTLHQIPSGGFSLEPVGTGVEIAVTDSPQSLNQVKVARLSDGGAGFILVKYAGAAAAAQLTVAGTTFGASGAGTEADPLTLAIPTLPTKTELQTDWASFSDKNGFILDFEEAGDDISLDSTIIGLALNPLWGLHLPADDPNNYLRVEYSGTETVPKVIVETGLLSNPSVVAGVLTVTIPENTLTTGIPAFSSGGFSISTVGDVGVPIRLTLPEGTSLRPLMATQIGTDANRNNYLWIEYLGQAGAPAVSVGQGEALAFNATTQGGRLAITIPDEDDTAPVDAAFIVLWDSLKIARRGGFTSAKYMSREPGDSIGVVDFSAEGDDSAFGATLGGGESIRVRPVREY